jgi:hypothetical protein
VNRLTPSRCVMDQTDEFLSAFLHLRKSNGEFIMEKYGTMWPFTTVTALRLNADKNDKRLQTTFFVDCPMCEEEESVVQQIDIDTGFIFEVCWACEEYAAMGRIYKTIKGTA